MRGRRCVCSCRSCGSSPIRSERGPVRAGVVGGLRPGWRGPERDRQHGPSAQSIGPGDAGGARETAGDPAGRAGDPGWASGGSWRHPRYTAMAHERPAGEVLYAFLRDSGMLARLAATRDRRPRRGASATSPGSSTSSGRSRPCSRTTVPCSSPGTCRR